jgi:hypothetical protein
MKRCVDRTRNLANIFLRASPGAAAIVAGAGILWKNAPRREVVAEDKRRKCTFPDLLKQKIVFIF